MVGRKNVDPSKNNNKLPDLPGTKKAKTSSGRSVGVVISKPFCKIILGLYLSYKYSDSKLNYENHEEIMKDFHEFPKLVQRALRVVYPEAASHTPVDPLDLISACFVGDLKLKTTGNTVEDRVNNAKLIPKKKNKIKLNKWGLCRAFEDLQPNHVAKLLDLINELINNNSLSADEVADLFKVKESGFAASLIEEAILVIDLSPNIEESKSLKNLKSVLDFICNLEISELDKAKVLSSVSLEILFNNARITGSPQVFAEKRKYFLDLLTNLTLQRFKEPESKDYLTKELTQSIINTTKSEYSTDTELYTLYINFILESNLFNAETIKQCMHNICSFSIENANSKGVLETVYLLLDKITTTNKLSDTDKINMLFQLEPLKNKIFKSNNLEQLKRYTEQLLQFSSTIGDLTTKKRLFSIIEIPNYDYEIDQNIFKEYIKLIKEDSRLTPEDKNAIVAMLKKENLTISYYSSYANAQLRILNTQSITIQLINTDEGSLYICKEAKKILNSLSNTGLVEVLSLKEGLYSQNGMPIFSDFIYNNIDNMITGKLFDRTVVYTITEVIAERYKAGDISKEDVKEICSLDAVINNKKLKDIFRDKWKANTNPEKTIMETIGENIRRSDIVTEILNDELNKIFD